MIVASLKRSYPRLVDQAQLKPDSLFQLALQLRTDTSGDWHWMSEDLLKGYTDVVVGTANNMIVSAHSIAHDRYPSGYTEVTDHAGTRRIRFDTVNPLDSIGQDPWTGTKRVRYDPVAWLVGCPIPGGPWKRGESRGTRRYLLEDYLTDHPELRARRDGEDYPDTMAEDLLRHFAGRDGNADVDDFPMLADGQRSGAATAADVGVTVVRQPGGTVVVTIPTGVRAQILIDPS